MEEQDKVKYQELKERTENVLFDNVKGQIDVSKHRQLIVDIVDTVGKDVEKITDNSTDMNQKFEEYKESQSELNAKQDIGINKNLQNINQLNDTIKLLSQKDEPIMSANGGGVVSLPNNAMKSVAPNYKFNGLTLNQPIDSYKNNYMVYYSEIREYKNNMFKLEVIDKAAAARIEHKKGNSIIPNNKYFVYGEIIPKHQGSTRIMVGTSSTPIRSLKLGELNVISGVVISSNADPLRFYHSTVEYEKGDNFEIGRLMCFNLTQAFGAGNEPTKEWCDEHIQGYFEGIKSVQTPMRVKSVGENLFSFNSNLIRNNLGKYIKVLGDNAAKLTHPEGWFDKYIYIFKCPIYKIKLGLECKELQDSRVGIKALTSDGKTIGGSLWMDKDNEYKEKIIESEKPIYGIQFSKTGTLSNKVEISKIFIGNGGYTPYQESLAYLNNELELSSITTTKDYIENGKLYKNISKTHFIRNIKADLGNVYRVQCYIINEASNISGSNKEAMFENDILPYRYHYNSDVEHFYIEKGTSQVFISKQRLEKEEGGTIDSKIDNFLANNAVYFKTNETEVINLDTSGNVVAHPNGTIFIEPIANVTAYYNDGLDVSNFNIESVEEFAIFKDGNYQSLDVSKIEITDNKLTHPDAINGLCYLVFRYDNAPIFGDNEVEYYNNDGILVSPDGTFWKPVLTVDDEGNILMKGEKL